jgi:hypothetical protein
MIKSIIPILLTFAVLLHLYYLTFISSYGIEYNHVIMTIIIISLIWLVYLIKYVQKEYKVLFYFLLITLFSSFIIYCISPLI